MAATSHFPLVTEQQGTQAPYYQASRAYRALWGQVQCLADSKAQAASVVLVAPVPQAPVHPTEQASH